MWPLFVKTEILQWTLLLFFNLYIYVCVCVWAHRISSIMHFYTCVEMTRKKHVWYMREISKIHSWDTQNTRMRHTWYMLETRVIHAWDTQNTRVRYTKYTRDVSDMHVRCIILKVLCADTSKEQFLNDVFQFVQKHKLREFFETRTRMQTRIR